MPKATRLFAVLSTLCAALAVAAVLVILLATGETDWPILIAGLLILPAAAVAWRRSKRSKLVYVAASDRRDPSAESSDS
jgi:hypothetical protein